MFFSKNTRCFVQNDKKRLKHQPWSESISKISCPASAHFNQNIMYKHLASRFRKTTCLQGVAETFFGQFEIEQENRIRPKRAIITVGLHSIQHWLKIKSVSRELIVKKEDYFALKILIRQLNDQKSEDTLEVLADQNRYLCKDVCQVSKSNSWKNTCWISFSTEGPKMLSNATFGSIYELEQNITSLSEQIGLNFEPTLNLLPNTRLQ